MFDEKKIRVYALEILQKKNATFARESFRENRNKRNKNEIPFVFFGIYPRVYIYTL